MIPVTIGLALFIALLLLIRALVGPVQHPAVNAGDRVRAMLASMMYVEMADISNTIEGEVISVDSAKGIVTVRDEDGDWKCLLAGTVVLKRRYPGRTP